MGLDYREYLRRFNRVNLCPQKWSIRVARVRAEEIVLTTRPEEVIVLLGSKVCSAFKELIAIGKGGQLPGPFDYGDILTIYGIRKMVVLPHPSGLSRAWNNPEAFERARRALKLGGVL
jgi:uracil-DNA glycosylase